MSTPTAGQVPPPDPVLVVSRDGVLVEELHRLAAPAESRLDVVDDSAGAFRRWASAPIVLVGADAIDELAASAPGRREGVHVVALGSAPEEVFPAALAVGVESVVELPSAETWLVETLTDTVDGARGRASLVGVVGGCGGAGATTFAAALSLTAAETAPVTLVDADPMGAGIERVIGLDEPAGAGWATLRQSAGRLGSRSLRTSLPRRGDLAVLGWGEGPRGDLEPGVVREVVSAARRGSGLVVADLPRHLDTGAAELLRRCDALLVVTPLTLPAVAAAAHAVRTLTPGVPRAFLVARGPATGLDPAEVSRLLGVPLAAEMADQRGLAEAVELGVGPLPRRRGPLLRAVRTTLARVGPSDPRTGVPT